MQIRYSVNGEEYKTYDQPFYLPSIPGEHSIRYFAEDYVLNVSQGKLSARSAEEYIHRVTKVYVDLTGPDLSQKFSGKYIESRDTVFINRDTEVVLMGDDPESGLMVMTYSIDGTNEETNYENPFTIDKSGFHTIEYYGYDEVNNRNVGNFFLFSDHEGPSIFYNFSSSPYSAKEGLNVYSSNVMVFLAATDAKVGLYKIYYKLNDNDFKEYLGKIKGLKPNEKYELTIRAEDQLGNENLSTVRFFTGK